MSNLAEKLTSSLLPKYRVTIDGQFYELESIINSRKIKLHSEKVNSSSIYIGKYLSNLCVFTIGGNSYANSGIVTNLNFETQAFEVGLFSELALELMEPDQALGEITPFKTHHTNENFRNSKRVNIRVEDAIHLTIKLNSQSLTVKLFDLSSFGFSFISDNKLTQDMTVPFEIKLRDGTFTGKGQVTWVQEANKKFKTGVKFTGFENVANLKCENQIVLKESYHIYGIFSKINFYFERSEFKILSLSKESFVIQIEKSDQYLLPGMKLDLKFSGLSSDNLTPATAEICFIDKGPNGTLIVGCNVENMADNLSAYISNYLLQFLDVSPAEVRNAGFDVSKIADVFSFRYVETHADYIEVLKLRYEAYLIAGKVDKNKKPADMAATLDPKSRILMVKHRGRLIASAAIAFPDSNVLILDTEKALPNGYSKDIPEKTNLIEISRLCTHPDYRKGDLLHRVFEHIYKIFVISGRDYILTSCDDKLWPLYSKLGFRKTGLQYNHLALNGLLHHIILVPIEVGLKVNKISLITWSYLYGSMYKDLSSKKVVKVNPYFRLKMALGNTLLFFLRAVFNTYSLIKRRR